MQWHKRIWRAVRVDASRHVPCVAVRPCHHCPSCAFASLPFLRVRLFARLIRWRRRRRCRRLTAPELAPPCLRSEPHPIHTLGRNATMSAPTITLYVSRPGNDALPCSADGPLPTRRLLWCLHRYPLCESPGPFRVNEHCPEQARREREREARTCHTYPCARSSSRQPTAATPSPLALRSPACLVGPVACSAVLRGQKAFSAPASLLASIGHLRAIEMTPVC